MSQALRSTPRYVRGRHDTEIAWHEYGTPVTREPAPGRPTVVLTNGLGTTANFWGPLASRLASDCRLVDWDYRAHGDSAVPKTHDYAIATHAGDLRLVTEAAMRSAPGQGPPVHVGFSMGVTVVLELYRRHPELVRALVLVAGGADHPYAASPAFRVPGVRAAVRGGFRAVAPVMPHLTPLTRRLLESKTLYSLGRVLGTLHAEAPREEIDHFLRTVGAMDMRSYWGSILGLLDAHASDVLPTVRVPVLIIAPENDVMAPERDMNLLRERIPGAEWTRIPGTGHAVLLEAGGAVAERIGAFLEELV
jgi:pimeloyl-ACP methyl ester carboxylesterase